MIEVSDPDTNVVVVAKKPTTIRVNEAPLLAARAPSRVAFSIVKQVDGDRGHGAKRWMIAHAPLLLAGVLPALMLSLGVGRFILNHFFARAPLLLDSGLLSGVAYRSGVALVPPIIGCDYATSFYQVYFSPVIGVLSGLSYLVPVNRIEWFAFVQALVYVPLGITVYALASRVGPECARRRLPITVLAAFAFAFSGAVLWMVGYPHYEAASPGLTCLVLVALMTGRTRMTWIWLGLAATVRQDGGVHIAVALLPVLYLQWRGVAMAPSRRRIVATIGIAVAASVVAFALQKLLFTPVDRLGPVYLGTPPYAHVTWDLVAARARAFAADSQVVYYPFLATVFVAILRRDARYLLGWAVTVPWFVFNLLAFDQAKSLFWAYAIGPFIVAMFWVYLYGALLAPLRMRPGVLELVFALVCISSTVGHARSLPDALRLTAHDMLIARPKDRAVVHAFVDALHDHRAALGRLEVDYAVAALAQEHLRLDEAWSAGRTPRPETLMFHDHAHGVSEVIADALTSGLDTCVRILETGIVVCSRAPLPPEVFTGLDTERRPASFALARRSAGVEVDERGVVLLTSYPFGGALGALAPGRYEWTLSLAATAPISAHIEVGDAAVDTHGERAVIPFSVGDADEQPRFRIRSRTAAPLVITSAQLRRLP